MTAMTDPFQPWTFEHILGLTLNSTTAVDGQRLAHARHWQTLSRDDMRLWGITPNDVRTAVDVSSLRLNEESMTCTCGTYMPCAHVLALLLMAQNGMIFPHATPPVFVRENVPLKRPIIKSDDVVRPDIQRGLLSLDHWLMALMRQGLADAQVRHFEFWDEMAKRMLAARMPSLSQWLRETGKRAAYGRDWVEPLLEELGRMYLLVRSFDRFDQLPFEVQADIRDAIGWRLPDGERDTVVDDWFVLGQRQRTLVDEMPEQTTWLSGLQSGRMALLHSLGSEEVMQTAPFVVGELVHTEVAYLPSRVPLKAQLRGLTGPAPALPVQGVRIEQAVEGFGTALARNPWLRNYPVLLNDVYVARFNKGWILRHADGTYLPLAPYFRHKWVLHGLHGGQSMQVGGIWDGHVLLPLSVITPTGVSNLNQVADYTTSRQQLKAQKGFA